MGAGFIGRLLVPTRYALFYRELHNREFSMLDVGCGNHSPTIARKWFPKCHYSGIDKERYNNTEEEYLNMEAYYEIDLETDGLQEIPNNHFDLVMLSHVIEHIDNGEEVVDALTQKLRQNGLIYIEYPSRRSLSLPSMRGTLNFFDDPTHKKLYDLRLLVNILSQRGFRTLKCGARRDWRKIAFFPLLVILGWLRGRPAAGFWYVTGFAEYILARREFSVTRE